MLPSCVETRAPFEARGARLLQRLCLGSGNVRAGRRARSFESSRVDERGDNRTLLDAVEKNVRERVAHFDAPLRQDHASFRVTDLGDLITTEIAIERYGEEVRIEQETNVERKPARSHHLDATEISRDDVYRRHHFGLANEHLRNITTFESADSALDARRNNKIVRA